MMPAQKLNIAYVIDYLHSVNGGTERQLHQIIKGMIERGHSVRLYVFRHTEFTKKLETFDCPIESLGITSLKAISTVAKLWSFRRRLVREKTDVIHGYFNDVALTLPLYFYGSGLQVFTSRRDMGIWYTPVNLFILRWLSRLESKIICNCNAVAELTRKEERIQESNINVIFNGIDSYSQPLVPDYGSKDVSSGLNVVLVANVRPVKRIEDLVSAASKLKNKSISYWVIGHILDHDYYQTLVATIESGGLADRFFFLGPVTEPRKILNDYQVGVISSDSEGLSNTLLEYLDAGLIAVATNVGGNPEIINNGKDGFLYEKGDVVELASILEEVEANPEGCQHIIENARAKFKLFSVENMILRHEEVYSGSEIQLNRSDI